MREANGVCERMRWRERDGGSFGTSLIRNRAVPTESSIRLS